MDRSEARPEAGARARLESATNLKCTQLLDE